MKRTISLTVLAFFLGATLGCGNSDPNTAIKPVDNKTSPKLAPVGKENVKKAPPVL